MTHTSRSCTVEDIQKIISDTLAQVLSKVSISKLSEEIVKRLQLEIEKAVHKVLPIGVELEGHPHITQDKKTLKLCVDWPIKFHSIGAVEQLKVERAGIEWDDQPEEDKWNFLDELKNL